LAAQFGIAIDVEFLVLERGELPRRGDDFL
jgi:hypothetical protein